MITVEGKIKTFSKYVYEKEVKNSREAVKEVENKNKEITETRQKEIQDKCMSINKKFNKKISAESQSIISAAKLNATEKILSVKKQILENFTKEILSALIDYTKKAEYDEYINDLLTTYKDYIANNGKVIYLVENDVGRYSKTIRKIFSQVEIMVMDDENIGGMIILSDSNSEKIALTLKRKVSLWSSEIGLRLNESLEK